MNTRPRPIFANGPLAVVSGLVLAAVVAAAVVRLAGIDIREPDAAAVQTRELRFSDESNGGVAVWDARTGARIDTLVGQQGFVRGALRGLARERRAEGLGSEAPFVLTARADGRLTLEDPSTRRRIDLESFGPTNAGAFARLLVAEAPASSTQASKDAAR